MKAPHIDVTDLLILSRYKVAEQICADCLGIAPTAFDFSLLTVNQRPVMVESRCDVCRRTKIKVAYLRSNAVMSAPLRNPVLPGDESIPEALLNPNKPLQLVGEVPFKLLQSVTLDGRTVELWYRQPFINTRQPDLLDLELRVNGQCIVRFDQEIGLSRALASWSTSSGLEFAGYPNNDGDAHWRHKFTGELYHAMSNTGKLTVLVRVKKPEPEPNEAESYWEGYCGL